MNKLIQTERLVWIIITLILACIITFLTILSINQSKDISKLAFQSGDLESELEAAKEISRISDSNNLEKLNKINKELEELKKNYDVAKNSLAEEILINRSWPLVDPQELSHLELKGLSNPQSDIFNDLREHPGLIPYKGQLGGKMQFTDIHLISINAVLANFDDGHIEPGVILLQFSVSDTGKISWKVLYAYCPSYDK